MSAQEYNKIVTAGGVITLRVPESRSLAALKEKAGRCSGFPISRLFIPALLEVASDAEFRAYRESCLRAAPGKSPRLCSYSDADLVGRRQFVLPYAVVVHQAPSVAATPASSIALSTAQAPAPRGTEIEVHQVSVAGVAAGKGTSSQQSPRTNQNCRN